MTRSLPSGRRGDNGAPAARPTAIVLEPAGARPTRLSPRHCGAGALDVAGERIAKPGKIVMSFGWGLRRKSSQSSASGATPAGAQPGAAAEPGQRARTGRHPHARRTRSEDARVRARRSPIRRQAARYLRDLPDASAGGDAERSLRAGIPRVPTRFLPPYRRQEIRHRQRSDGFRRDESGTVPLSVRDGQLPHHGGAVY